MPNPVHGTFHLVNTLPGDKLRPGDIVSGKITAVLPNGRFNLYCNGRTLTAKSSLLFQTGDLLKARVVQNSTGLYLHLLGSSLKSTPADPSSVTPGALLSAALLRAGLSLPDEAEGLRRAALLNRTGGSRVRMARLYAEMLAKGTDPGAAFLETLDRMFSQSPLSGSMRRWVSTPDHKELQEELCDTDAGSSETSDSDSTLLNLLGSVSGKNHTWMFKKLLRRLGDGELRMTWKIRSGMNPALALTVYDGDRTFEFLMEGLENTQMSVYSDDADAINEEQWITFRKRLALMNVDVGDTILPISTSDGFTPGSGQVLQNLEDRG